VMEDRMCGDFVQHSLQSLTARLDKFCLKPANGLLLWRWWDYYTGVVVVQRVVKPQEVSVSPRNGEFGLFVCL